MYLTKEQEYQWREEGYCIVNNLINQDIINDCYQFILKYYDNKNVCTDFGSNNHELEFPTNTVLDKLYIHEHIIKSAQQLLKTDEILLTQADTWSKSGNNTNNTNITNRTNRTNGNQRMHMDYGNHTFLHASDWYTPECVAMIIYLSDIKITGGGTAIVKRLKNDDEAYQEPYINMPGQAKNHFYNDKDEAENYFKKTNIQVYNFRKKLYDREIIPQPSIGDILFYRLDTWHRGTPVFPNKIRNVMNIVWKKKECYWIQQWNMGFTKKMYKGLIENLFITMTPLQRSVFGVPMPGDAFWTLKKLQLLVARYPGIDINPYIISLN